MHRKKMLITVFLLFAIFFLGPDLLFAQTENASAIITWTTDAFAPSNYEGKIMPTNGSNIYLYLTAKKSGKIIDLSALPILWYLDNEFLEGAIGKTSAAFKVRKLPGDYHYVKAEVQLAGGEKISGYANIPVLKPKAVINFLKGFENFRVYPNSTVNLSLIPYFFNIKTIEDLNFSWNIQIPGSSYKTDGESGVLINTGNLPEGQKIEISASAQNKINPLESAFNKKTIYVGK